MCARLTGVGTGVNINNDGRTVSKQLVIRRGGWSRQSETRSSRRVILVVSGTSSDVDDAETEQLVRVR